MNFRPKKSLGQHWLNDPIVLDKIIDAAGIAPGESVLEVGPGQGVLTSELLKAGANVVAVELDQRAVNFLETEFPPHDNLQIKHADILSVEIDEIFAKPPYQIVANLPYQITAPFLRKMLENPSFLPTQMVLMIQKEVAQKLTDPKKSSTLKLAVEIFAEVEYLFSVGKECFDPPPKVESAVIRVVSREKPLIPADEQKKFFATVRRGFSQKRKKLRNIFKDGWDHPLLSSASFREDSRPETLSWSDWKLLTQWQAELLRLEKTQSCL